MGNSYRQSVLALLSGGDLSTAAETILEQVGADHPDGKRVRNLQKRLQELEGRVQQGTLSTGEVSRLRDRISGGLRDVLLNPIPAQAETPSEEKGPSFTFVAPEPETKPIACPEGKIGFLGEVTYAGSPSKKEASLVLQKGYGASYHAAVQAIRKCGMTMESGDRAGGKIHATSTGNTVARFGEVIHVWVHAEERGRTRVHVVVDSANPDTIFDLGRHQQKLDALLHQLRQ
ncbi:MAG: hypothetical protein AAFN92_14890 [Bacteroidota bacterium]